MLPPLPILLLFVVLVVLVLVLVLVLLPLLLLLLLLDDLASSHHGFLIDGMFGRQILTAATYREQMNARPSPRSVI